MEEADNYRAWLSVQAQIARAVKVGMLTRKRAREVLERARESYRRRNAARAADMMRDKR